MCATEYARGALLHWPDTAVFVRFSTKGPILAASTEVFVRTSEPPKLHPIARLRELLRAREILSNLIRKDVKIKYKSSVLGAAWSMLNPILYLAVFTLVFTVVLPNHVPQFPVYLLSGHALALWVSALNVRYRDTQHLVQLALLLWFWFTPVVYPSGFLASGRLANRHVLGVSLYHLVLANPMADIVIGFQRALYRVVQPAGAGQPILLPVSLGWLAIVLGIVAMGSILLLLLCWRAFFHMSGDFAEEL